MCRYQLDHHGSISALGNPLYQCTGKMNLPRRPSQTQAPTTGPNSLVKYSLNTGMQLTEKPKIRHMYG